MLMPSNSIIFSVETTSALFIHGADNGNQAEIRPPAIKGVMRYWFRALAGAYCSVQELQQKEAEMFGSTTVGARLIVHVMSDEYVSSTKKSLLPQHKGELLNQGRDPASPSPAILAGKQFKIVLQSYPPVPDANSRILQVAAWTLWTAIHLGGFGQRSRRGAGSLQLLETEGWSNGPLEKQSYHDIEDAKQHLEQGLRSARAAIAATISGSKRNPASDGIAGFPVIAPDCAIIQIIKLEARDEEIARSQIMRGLRSYKNPVFGLPYNIKKPGEVKGRHASPLHLHLMPLTAGYALVQTVLFSRFDRKVDNKVNHARLEDYLASFPAAETVRIQL